METTRKRRWWQFGLKTLLVVTLSVAAYFAGQSNTLRRAEKAERELDRSERELARIKTQVADFMDYRLHSDAEVERAAKRLPPRVPLGTGMVELAKSAGIDLSHCPQSTDWNGNWSFRVSPGYVLSFNRDSNIQISRNKNPLLTEMLEGGLPPNDAKSNMLFWESASNQPK